MSELSPEIVYPAAPDGEALFQSFRSLVRRVESTPEVSVRVQLMRRALEEGDATENVWWMDQVIRGALWGHNAQIDAMHALSTALILIADEKERANYPRDRDAACALFREHYLAAHESGRESVLNLLRDAPPHRQLGKSSALPEVRLPFDRDVTLGERRSLARLRDRQLLTRLLMDPNALVIRNLLPNPMLRTEDVLVIASRRPTRPDLLREVAMSERWRAIQDVREALVINPFCDTGVALKFLPTLPIRQLRQIRNANDLHPLVHDYARLLVELREQRTAPLCV